MSGVIDIVEAVIVIVLLDLVSGLVHWAEDTFWTESTPVLGDWVVAPNVIHHRDGAAFLRNSWFRSSWDLLLAGVLIVLMAWSLRLLTWQVCLFVLVGVNANQIHKWNHMPRSRVPAAVKLLQRARLLQAATDHAAHHRGAKNTSYCVVTPFVNPILDALGFWRILEHLLVPVFPAPRREDLRP